MMVPSRRRSTSTVGKIGIGLTALTVASAAGLAFNVAHSAYWQKSVALRELFTRKLTKKEVASIVGRRVFTSEKTALVLEDKYHVQLSIDERLQAAVERALKRAQIQHGAFVALDPSTGKVLAMASHGTGDENFNLRSNFPAASVFKVVTAAAAIEDGVLEPKSMIPVLGSYHTLYKRNVLKGGLQPEKRPRYARLISFEDALAKSVNSVFGKVGIFGVGPDGLRKTAQRFQFGRDLPFDLPVYSSVATIPNDDEFGVAESASGFTRLNTLSPLHGALIAAAVANGGVMMEPSIVQSLTATDKSVEYAFEPRTLSKVIDPETAEQLAQMMHRTVTNGTSRRTFRNAKRNSTLSDVFIAGKTGTLDGWDPPGRYDWFVGFAERGEHKIAFAALNIHGKYYGLKAAYVARQALEAFFGPVVAENPAASDQGNSSSRKRSKI